MEQCLRQSPAYIAGVFQTSPELRRLFGVLLRALRPLWIYRLDLALSVVLERLKLDALLALKLQLAPLYQVNGAVFHKREVECLVAIAAKPEVFDLHYALVISDCPDNPATPQIPKFCAAIGIKASGEHRTIVQRDNITEIRLTAGRLFPGLPLSRIRKSAAICKAVNCNFSQERPGLKARFCSAQLLTRVRRGEPAFPVKAGTTPVEALGFKPKEADLLGPPKEAS